MSTDTNSTSEIRTRVKKQIATAQGLRMESMQRQGRVLIVKKVSTGSSASTAAKR